jgi:chemotaxis protein methyltransferase CheR
METPTRAGPTGAAQATLPGGGATGLGPEQFATISELLQRITGIRLQEGKEELVRARLWKRLHALGLPDFSAYINLLQSKAGAEELVLMVDALSTNKTDFFRESPHFDFLGEQARALAGRPAPLRLWSAGCSSGEEPYSIAITLLQALPASAHKSIRILATDISTEVLGEARAGVYAAEDMADVPPTVRQKYFRVDRSTGAERYRVNDAVRSLISFANLNLMAAWPMRGPFDFIFCRNVMIYFDRPTQDHLVRRFGQLLAPGAFLLIGHSETLGGRSEEFVYRMPAVYQRR